MAGVRRAVRGGEGVGRSAVFLVFVVVGVFEEARGRVMEGVLIRDRASVGREAYPGTRVIPGRSGPGSEVGGLEVWKGLDFGVYP
jgi:hypothetical protein